MPEYANSCITVCHFTGCIFMSLSGVYLTNPQEIVPEYVIRQQLCSPAELLVQRKDILSHWGEDCDLGVLARQKDQRWRLMNVLG